MKGVGGWGNRKRKRKGHGSQEDGYRLFQNKQYHMPGIAQLRK
jgi:hypothetical protein